MKTEAYSIYDSKSKTYTPPFFMRQRGEAIRAFTQTANDPSSNINKFPEDYSLFHIGFYDDNTGKLEYCNPDNIGLATQFISFTDQPPLNTNL